MKCENRLVFDQEQLDAFIAKPEEGPVCMVNLIKFREKAEYEDGRETDLSGYDAYQLYGGPMGELISQNGGKVIYSSAVDTLICGETDELWDVCVIVEYPSRKGFTDLILSDHVRKVLGVHRRAGLAGQLNIATIQNN